MNLKEEYDFDLVVNEIMTLVINELERQLENDTEKQICRCQECILDITALSMNRLKPAYRSSLSYTGVLYKQNLRSAKKDKAVEKIVKEAIEKIRNNPSHE